MAEIPTAEENGRRMLAIYAENNSRPGEMMLWQGLRSQFLATGGRADDFNAGLDWLLSEGLLEQPPDKPRMYFLTQAGFEAM